MPTLSAKSKRKSSRSCGSLCLVTRHVHVTFYRRIVRVRIDLCLSITSIALCFLARHSPRPPAPDRPPAQHIHRRQHQHQARVRAGRRSATPPPRSARRSCAFPQTGSGFSRFGTTCPSHPDYGLRGLHLFLAGRQGRRDCEVAEKAQRNRVVEKCMASKAHEVRVAEQSMAQPTSRSC